MKSNASAGFKSKPAADGSAGYQPSAVIEEKKEKTEEENFKEIEEEVHRLLEASALAKVRKDLGDALTKAKEAASKEKKSRDLDMFKGMLSNDDTLLVAGFRFQGLSVRKLGKPYKPIFIFFPAGCWSLVPALQVGTGRIKAKKPRATHVIFE